jgi:hypothetical protein
LPLDGGKMLYALLSKMVSFYRLQQLMTHLGLFVSLCLLVYSVTASNLSGIHVNLMILALFLFFINLIQLRQLPLIFIRFLMQKWIVYQREAQLSEGQQRFFSRQVKQTFIVRNQALHLVLRHVYRTIRHRFVFVATNHGSKVIAVEENELLARFFDTQGVDE